MHSIFLFAKSVPVANYDQDSTPLVTGVAEDLELEPEADGELVEYNAGGVVRVGVGEDGAALRAERGRVESVPRIDKYSSRDEQIHNARPPERFHRLLLEGRGDHSP